MKEPFVSSQVPQVGSRLVVVPRLADGSSGDQIPGRVLASREDLVRISWDLDHDGVYQRGDEFTIIGRDLRRRAIFLSGEGGTANLVLRGEASESTPPLCVCRPAWRRTKARAPCTRLERRLRWLQPRVEGGRRQWRGRDPSAH